MNRVSSDEVRELARALGRYVKREGRMWWSCNARGGDFRAIGNTNLLALRWLEGMSS